MNLTRRNLQVGDILETVKRANESLPAMCRVRVAYVRQPGADWRFFMARFQLTDTPGVELTEVYREYAFFARTLEPFCLDDFLRKITADGHIVVDGFPPIKMSAATPQWQENIIPGHVSGGFAIRQFSAFVSSDAYFYETALAAYGMPYRPSAQRRLNEFMELSGFQGANDARKGELAIEIEDRRGRIELKNGHLAIADRKVDLCIVGQVNGDLHVSVTESEVIAIDDEAINSIELVMLTKTNEIVDYWSSSDWEYKFGSRAAGIDLQDALIAQIHRGENESCEFKPYIDLRDQANAKLAEIEIAVCALSNLNGGTLFIGVADDGEIQGVAGQIRKSYGGEITQARTMYLTSLQKRLGDALNNTQCVSIESVEIYSKIVFVVTVQKSHELNFLVTSKQAYIRRGATSARMTPPEIQSHHVRSPLTMLDVGA
jgi:Putative DNA-binding domain